MKQTSRIALSIALFASLPSVPSASAQSCEELTLTVGGSLSEKGGPATIELPVGLLGSDDARALIRLSPAGPGRWAAQLSSGFRRDPISFRGVSFIQFDEAGKQTLEQRFFFQPFSNDQKVGQSGVTVVIDRMRLSGESNGASVVNVAREPADCFVQGGLDLTGRVNGGRKTALTEGLQNVPEGFRYEPSSLEAN
jgi:hypothetical protein